MVEIPTRIIIWDIQLIHVLASVVSFWIGVVMHELMHIAVATLFKIDYSIEIAPKGWKNALFVNGLVNINLESYPSRLKMAAILLSPVVAISPAIMALIVILSAPAVKIGVFAVFGAWFIGALPGLDDILRVASYDPDGGVDAEVAT